MNFADYEIESYNIAYKGGGKLIFYLHKAPHMSFTNYNKVRSRDLRITRMKGVSTMMTHCSIAICSL